MGATRTRGPALLDLGRFDRPWGPERKVFGKIRFMEQLKYGQKATRKRLSGAVRWSGHAGAAFSAR